MEFPLQFDIPPVMRPSESSRMVDAVTLHGHGSVDKVVFEQTPLPKEVGERNVEVEVEFCGLNMTDNYLRLGIIRQSRFPVVMGSECAGVVRRVGAAVTRFKVGQRVLCLKMHGGLFRRRVHVPEKSCFPIPKGVPSDDAVALGLDFLTAYVCLFEIGGLRKKQSVFVQSIGGGVGVAALQLARTVPAVTVLGTASAAKHEDVLRLGAAIVFRPGVNCEGGVLKYCPWGVDILINSGGGADLSAGCRLLKPFGKHIMIGSNNTAIYPASITWGFRKPTWDVLDIPTKQLTSNNYCTAGLNIGSFIENHPERVSEILGIIFQLYKNQTIKPVSSDTLPIEKVDVGFTLLCMRSNLGKVLLLVKRPEDRSYVTASRHRSSSSGGSVATHHHVPSRPFCSSSGTPPQDFLEEVEDVVDSEEQRQPGDGASIVFEEERYLDEVALSEAGFGNDVFDNDVEGWDASSIEEMVQQLQDLGQEEIDGSSFLAGEEGLQDDIEYTGERRDTYEGECVVGGELSGSDVDTGLRSVTRITGWNAVESTHIKTYAEASSPVIEGEAFDDRNNDSRNEASGLSEALELDSSGINMNLLSYIQASTCVVIDEESENSVYFIGDNIGVGGICESEDISEYYTAANFEDKEAVGCSIDFSGGAITTLTSGRESKDSNNDSNGLAISSSRREGTSEPAERKESYVGSSEESEYEEAVDYMFYSASF